MTPEFDFDDIPLYLVGLTYDACLDDSVEMAKKWKGIGIIVCFKTLMSSII